MTDTSGGTAPGDPGPQGPGPESRDWPPPVGRPAPRYGEYAPAGWSAPEPAPAASPVPGGYPPAPGYGPQGTPQYPAYPYQPYPGQPPYNPRRFRTGDIVATCILLAVGVLGTFVGVVTALGLQQSLELLYLQEGLGTYVPDPRIPAVSALVTISHLVLLAGAAVGSILLIRKRRLAFWVPLTAGVVAAIIFWVALGTIVSSDPNLLLAYS